MPFILTFPSLEVNAFLKNLYDKKERIREKRVEACWDLVELAERYVFS